jgi:tRNA1(Val) A37 N6-methylase TrmN6
LEAVEKHALFVEYARINARVNKIEYTLHESDFLDFESEQKYDYIISNPPFYPEGVQKSDNEMLFHARYNIHLPLDGFFKKVSQLLKPHSHFIFCYDASQFGDICVALERVKMRACHVQFVHPKIDKTASLVMIHARNGSRSQMQLLPPFVNFDRDGQSQEALRVYKNAKTQSIKCQI